MWVAWLLVALVRAAWWILTAPIRLARFIAWARR